MVVGAMRYAVVRGIMGGAVRHPGRCHLVLGNNAIAEFSTRRRGGGLRRRKQAPAPPPQTTSEDGWVEVQDPGGSHLTYWWNEHTNQVTALGEPKPTAVGAVQQEQAPGLGSMVAQGFAFGAGSAVAHTAVNSIFGGGGSHDDAGDVGGDDWDL